MQLDGQLLESEMLTILQTARADGCIEAPFEPNISGTEDSATADSFLEAATVAEDLLVTAVQTTLE